MIDHVNQPLNLVHDLVNKKNHFTIKWLRVSEMRAKSDPPSEHQIAS